MLTFLELYQTLLGFVFFKLYTDAGLVYPPPLDAKRADGGAGIGAFQLQNTDHTPVLAQSSLPVKAVSSKDVRQAIKSITTDAPAIDIDTPMHVVDDKDTIIEADEEFVRHPSTTEADAIASLPTLQSLSTIPDSHSTSLFSPYTFFLSREVSRTVFEFLVRSFGGRVGWPPSSGSGSPFTESDESITHVIIDRPLTTSAEGSEEKTRRAKRHYVQPQWVVDCINARQILLEALYAQGVTLPPHLSPFDAKPGAYDPTAPLAEEGDSGEEAEQEADSERESGTVVPERAKVLNATDAGVLRAVELAAEAAGVDYGDFQKDVQNTQRTKKTVDKAPRDEEVEMNKMLLSNKKRRLYERMKYSERKRGAEVCLVCSWMGCSSLTPVV